MGKKKPGSDRAKELFIGTDKTSWMQQCRHGLMSIDSQLPARGLASATARKHKPAWW